MYNAHIIRNQLAALAIGQDMLLVIGPGAVTQITGAR